jgi:sterol desaturase/sphingolipid hydroxylase (fatty acid hydroxylase superfamily)
MDRAWLTFATCAVPIAFLVASFGTIVLMRWFKHREIMTLAEKGLLPQQYTRYMSASRGRGLLGWGIALVMLGLALMIGLWPIGFVGRPGPEHGSWYPLNFGPWMLVGLIPLFIGLALLIIYFLTRKEETLVPEMTSVEEGEISGD